MRSRSFFTRVGMGSIALTFLLAGSVYAQHDAGGGTAGDAVGGSVGVSSKSGHRAATRSTSSTTPRRKVPPKRTTLTAEDYFEQGEAFFNNKQYAEAIDAYQKAIKINPNYATPTIGWAGSTTSRRNIRMRSTR